MEAGSAGESAAESELPEADEADILEERGRDYKRDERAALPVAAVEAAAFAAKRAAPSMHRAHSAIMREYS